MCRNSRKHVRIRASSQAKVRLIHLCTTLILLLTGALPCLALPIAGAYPSGRTALKAPSEEERQLSDLINADLEREDVSALTWNALLSAVAREHSQDMADHDYIEYFSPRLGSIEYRLHRAGASAPNSRYAIFQANSLDEVMASMTKEARPFHRMPATQIGVGIVVKGRLAKRYFVTLIVGEKHSSIEPFPTAPILNKGYWLKGYIEEGYADPHLIVTLPDGTVEDRLLELDENRRFETIVAFDQGRGKYIVEITASGNQGPLILELMHCFAGVDYPGPDRAKENMATPNNLYRAERLMAQMVHRARLENNRDLLEFEYDDDLAKVAREHSKDMMKNRFFAHVSSTTGTLMDRIQAEEIKVRSAAENLASNTDIGAAHRGLLDSPGHRKNILDPNMDRIGIGIVRDMKNQLIITQVFAESFPTYDTMALMKNFLAEANRLRDAKGLPRLKANTKLNQIALENSRTMRDKGQHSVEKASDLLKKARLPMAVQIAVFQSSDPLTPEKVKPMTERAYREIGIAIVQSESDDGVKYLWTTVLLGKKP